MSRAIEDKEKRTREAKKVNEEDSKESKREWIGREKTT